MLGDVADAANLVFGEALRRGLRRPCHFLSMVAQAIGISLAMAILGYFGFQQADPGQTVLAQPETAQNAIKALMSFTPLLLMGLA